MVDFVLKDDGQHSLRIDFQRVAIPVMAFNGYGCSAFHISSEVGNTEATFILGYNLSFSGDDLGIDQNMQGKAFIFGGNIKN